MTALMLFASIILGGASLAWGYAGVALAPLSRWIMAFTVIWLVAAWRRWRWFAYVGLTFNFLSAALGLWFLNFPPGWMFAGAILGLMAWDLTDFQYRERFAASEEEKSVAETRHLQRISVLALLGFLLASVAMGLKLQFNFEWAALFVVVTALSLMQIIRWFRRRG
jgi:hypothetical protein